MTSYLNDASPTSEVRIAENPTAKVYGDQFGTSTSLIRAKERNGESDSPSGGRLTSGTV